MPQEDNIVLKKEKKKRIFLLILLLVFTIALCLGSTYAWFNYNTKVNIQSLELEAEASNGLEISTDAITWVHDLTINDIFAAAGLGTYDTNDIVSYGRSKDAGSVNQIPERVKNISSVGNINSLTNKLQLFSGRAASLCHVSDKDPDGSGPLEASPDYWYGVENDDYSRGEGAVRADDCDSTEIGMVGLVKISEYKESNRACADKGKVYCDDSVEMMVFDLYLKTDSPQIVSLSPSSYVKNSSHVDYGLKNVVRVAFVTQGTQPLDYYNLNDKSMIDSNGKGYGLSSAKPENVQYAKSTSENGFGGIVGYPGARRMNGFGSITIWEPNANNHSYLALNNALIYGRTVNGKDITSALVAVIPSDELPIPYSKANDGDADYGKYFALQQDVFLEDIMNDPNTKYKNPINYATSNDENPDPIELFVTPAGVTRLRVYIWVEGNDIDAENNATSSEVKVKLSFTTATTKEKVINSSMYESYIRTDVAREWRINAPSSARALITGNHAVE